jgi:hypothetical protein
VYKPTGRVNVGTVWRYSLAVQAGEPRPKMRNGFWSSPQFYESFEELASKNGYTATSAFENFLFRSLEIGLQYAKNLIKMKFQFADQIRKASDRDGRFSLVCTNRPVRSMSIHFVNTFC